MNTAHEITKAPVDELLQVLRTEDAGSVPLKFAWLISIDGEEVPMTQRDISIMQGAIKDIMSFKVASGASKGVPSNTIMEYTMTTTQTQETSVALMDGRVIRPTISDNYYVLAKREGGEVLDECMGNNVFERGAPAVFDDISSDSAFKIHTQESADAYCNVLNKRLRVDEEPYRLCVVRRRVRV